jgi:hypothetical protein
MAARPSDRGFDDAYIGVPPWDIGRPQREVLALASASAFRSPVSTWDPRGENVAPSPPPASVLGIDHLLARSGGDGQRLASVAHGGLPRRRVFRVEARAQVRLGARLRAVSCSATRTARVRASLPEP